jgi:hypothetical protein
LVVIDLRALDATIAKTTVAEAVAGKAAAIVTKSWLEEVRKELAELAELRAVVAMQKTEQVAIAAIEARR